jgi:MCRA family
MRAHIVGGGFGGLAAAALLIRNAGVSGEDITIYEADERMGGGFFLGGSAESDYNLPGSVFDKEYRCTFELLKSIPSASNPSISVTDEFFAFNTGEPYHDRAHIFDRDGRIVHGPRFRPQYGRRPQPGAGSANARSDAGRAARRGVLFSAIFLDRILVPLVDDHLCR